MQLFDTVTLDGIRRTQDGYLVADAKVARTGIQLYTGREVDPDNKHGLRDKAIVKVYRPEEEVFAQDAMHSYAFRPVTDDHPSESVTADNWKSLAVGQTGNEVVRDGEFVRVPLVLMDKAIIAKVEGGKRELSMGYSTDLKFQDGVTPGGEQYDAIQTTLRMNHLAVVSAARGGSHLKIGDDAKGKRSMTTRTLLVDGLSVELADKDAQIVQRAMDGLNKQIADLQSAAGEHKATIVQKDEEIGTLKADLKKAQDSALKPEDVDKLVADRSALVTTIKAIDAKIEVSGKSDVDLRRAAVTAKLGDEMVKDASDAEISGMFKAVAKDVKTADPFAAVVKDGLKPTDTSNSTTAHASMVSDMATAWMGNQSKGAA
ncbi:DUF2213 domain-containing protein [Rhizobium favelukesii]|uniref:DUF2213 domain-containing protein n=1 Tax=Rhizobium favelukesii TaxID=348824 RepID=UPI0021606AD8|nr:DUF2213 domain-containing protein [Rhizobium favelukesii]MCS0459525.1 DUF2213 domain-containing protein [Rhizobium favelukesii]